MSFHLFSFFYFVFHSPTYICVCRQGISLPYFLPQVENIAVSSDYFFLSGFLLGGSIQILHPSPKLVMWPKTRVSLLAVFCIPSSKGNDLCSINEHPVTSSFPLESLFQVIHYRPFLCVQARDNCVVVQTSVSCQFCTFTHLQKIVKTLISIRN